MAERLERFFNSTVFFFFAVILLCLILLTPVDAIYQCYETNRLTNIFFITGAYVATFFLAVLIYATRMYTNRSTLNGIPKAWIPIEKEDVNKSVRRLVMEGLARSAVISYQARPRNTSDEVDSFENYQNLLVDPVHPPWGHVEHPGWSSPASPDLPDLPYRTVIQELPNLIEAKAVSLAPADMLASASLDPFPDTRVVEVLQRSASMGLRQYVKHLTSLGAIDPPELGGEFLVLYERARFSSHELSESEFRDLMHLFAEILRGMTSLTTPVLDEIRDSASFRRADSESFIGSSDEEGETDTVDHYGYDSPFTLMRTNSLRPSNASTWETRSGFETAPATQSPASTRSPGGGYFARGPLRTPSTRSLRRVQSVHSGSSGGSVIRLTQTRSPTDLPYTFNYAGRRN
ncbi:hypothetical protein N7448_001237 [Penicillium atrosanguineum]|uniref:Defect at low temperature protein 1 n=1 Tax=Penicillium atrosanguineum TaxID=1132637 RepID=A0A9W9Q8X3_9EURO|nr:uncharacterized protein N7443_004635 [Penicillium atrosanguineum]KAJ5133742.1 hypothetical protein N7526_005107 [Penicillium atrosanguineum]KAJ5149659.1 hypothetical protein N7448_001237 [Penicillium atrosanguineum]KAJ5304975.1 hypothetical protein N7443_004635 [Penicillium atrosanguineum]KAJ5324441.1 hypothetical protein N7476_003041 [Penicillium atrosanguineum]